MAASSGINLSVYLGSAAPVTIHNLSKNLVSSLFRGRMMVDIIEVLRICISYVSTTFLRQYFVIVGIDETLQLVAEC